MAKCLRERTIPERLEMVFDANRMMRGLIEARLRDIIHNVLAKPYHDARFKAGGPPAL